MMHLNWHQARSWQRPFVWKIHPYREPHELLYIKSKYYIITECSIHFLFALLVWATERHTHWNINNNNLLLLLLLVLFAHMYDTMANILCYSAIEKVLASDR